MAHSNVGFLHLFVFELKAGSRCRTNGKTDREMERQGWWRSLL